MFDVDLEKELVHKNKARKDEVTALTGIPEMQLLLENTSKEEEKVLATFGLDENLRKVQALRGTLIESEKFEEEYGNIYSRQHIKELALTYRLRFLPLNLFRGGIDPLLGAKIVDFCKKHKIDATGATDQFYVLAPSEDFQLAEELHRAPAPRPIVAQDPLLFYRPVEDREGKYWTLVHKWGTEFNYLRMIKSWKYRNEANYTVYCGLVWSALLFLAFTGLVGGFTVPVWTIVLPCLVIGAIAGMVQVATIGESKAKNLFTETNWSDSRYHKDVAWNY